jgi:hypothetical protein
MWKNNPPYQRGVYTTKELAELDPTGEKGLRGSEGFDARDARYWMADDVIKKIRGKSREEVRALLGEPIPPAPFRALLVDRPDRWYMAYALSPDGLFGSPELLIRFDERGRVKEAKVAHRTT